MVSQRRSMLAQCVTARRRCKSSLSPSRSSALRNGSRTSSTLSQEEAGGDCGQANVMVGGTTWFLATAASARNDTLHYLPNGDIHQLCQKCNATMESRHVLTLRNVTVVAFVAVGARARRDVFFPREVGARWPVLSSVCQPACLSQRPNITENPRIDHFRSSFWPLGARSVPKSNKESSPLGGSGNYEGGGS
eukprot:gene307-biopygen9119